MCTFAIEERGGGAEAAADGCNTRTDTVVTTLERNRLSTVNNFKHQCRSEMVKVYGTRFMGCSRER